LIKLFAVSSGPLVLFFHTNGPGPLARGEPILRPPPPNQNPRAPSRTFSSSSPLPLPDLPSASRRVKPTVVQCRQAFHFQDLPRPPAMATVMQKIKDIEDEVRHRSLPPSLRWPVAAAEDLTLAIGSGRLDAVVCGLLSMWFPVIRCLWGSSWR
jgi:hypothetical protein